MLDRIHESLRTLEHDLNEGGWDQPSKLYVVEEAWPYFVKTIDFHDHPCEILDQLPVLNKDNARGLVLATEAWQVAIPQEMIDELYRTIDGQEGVNLSEEEKDTLIKEAIKRAHTIVRPSQHPNRIESRFITCLLKDGTTIVLARKRGEDAEFMPEAEKFEGRIYDSMKRVLGLEATQEST